MRVSVANRGAEAHRVLRRIYRPLDHPECETVALSDSIRQRHRFAFEAFTRYEIHCIAEKSPSSTDDRTPIQKHYRVDDWHLKTCLQSAQRFFRSKRPSFSAERTFDPADIPRIDSSDYPEQMAPVAVF